MANCLVDDDVLSRMCCTNLPSGIQNWLTNAFQCSGVLECGA